MRSDTSEMKRTHQSFPLFVNRLQFLIKYALFLEFMIGPIQKKSRSSILYRVVCVGLNVLIKHDPGEESQRQSTLSFSEEI